MRIILSILTLLMVTLTSIAEDVLTMDGVRATLSKYPLHDIEGIWQLTADGDMVVIMREVADMESTLPVATYTVKLLQASTLTALPGLVLGRLCPTAQADSYEATLYSDYDTATGRGIKPKKYLVKMEDEAHLSLKELKRGVRISPLAVFPYFPRKGIKYENNRPADLDGAIKVYPEVAIKGAPRYL